MKTTYLIILLILPAVGCMGLKPVGPITTGMFEQPQPKPVVPNAESATPKDVPAMPPLAEGPKPPAPTFNIGADDVNKANARNSAMQLQREIETDLKNADLIPQYPEVSHVKRR
jgi:hypothetical protein